METKYGHRYLGSRLTYTPEMWNKIQQCSNMRQKIKSIVDSNLKKNNNNNQLKHNIMYLLLMPR